MHLVQESNHMNVVRCRLGVNQAAMTLTANGYSTVKPVTIGHSQYYYPYPVAAPFKGSELIEPFYAYEKQYLDEITDAFEKQYGVKPEKTWYILFWDRENKIEGISMVASSKYPVTGQVQVKWPTNPLDKMLNGMTLEQAAKALIEGRLSIKFNKPSKNLLDKVARHLYVDALNCELEELGSPVRVVPDKEAE